MYELITVFFLVRSPAIHNELDTYGATTQSIHLLGLIHSPTCCCRFHTILWLTTTWYLNIVGNFPKDKIIPVFLGKSSVHFRARSSQLTSLVWWLFGKLNKKIKSPAFTLQRRIRTNGNATLTVSRIHKQNKLTFKQQKRRQKFASQRCLLSLSPSHWFH